MIDLDAELEGICTRLATSSHVEIPSVGLALAHTHIPGDQGADPDRIFEFTVPSSVSHGGLFANAHFRVGFAKDHDVVQAAVDTLNDPGARIARLVANSASVRTNTLKYTKMKGVSGTDVIFAADARPEWSERGAPPYKEALQYLGGIYNHMAPLLKEEGLDTPLLVESMHETIWGEHMPPHNTIAVRLRYPLSIGKAGGLFITREMATLIMIHELAHIRHNGHTPQFHAYYNTLRERAQRMKIFNPNYPGISDEEKFILEELHSAFIK